MVISERFLCFVSIGSMNKLINISSSQGEQTMTSRDVAKLTGKRHDHVIRDCRKLNDYYKGNERPQISVGQYLAGNGEERPQFELTKRQTLDLCMGYSLALRIAVTDRWEELEKQLTQPQFEIPSSFSQALALASQLQEDKETLLLEVKIKDVKIEEDAPKIRIYEDLIDSDELVPFSVACKALGIGLRKLYAFLRKKKVVSSKRGSTYNIPHQSFVDRGYFDVKAKPWNQVGGESGVNYSAYITGAGMIWLEKYLDKNF